jgi:hypothetical protein
MTLEKYPQEANISSTRDSVLDIEPAAHEVPLADVPKGRWDRSWPVIACGAGLFSDGKPKNIRVLAGGLPSRMIY